MSSYRKTKTPGVYARHEQHCPRANGDDGPRCRCAPSFRGRRRHPVTKRPEWSPTMKDRAAVLTWLSAAAKGREASRRRRSPGRRSGSSAASGSKASSTGRSASAAARRARRTARRRSRATNGRSTTNSTRSSAPARRARSSRSNGRCGPTGSRATASRGRASATTWPSASAIYGWPLARRAAWWTATPPSPSSCRPTTSGPARACTAEEAAQLLAVLETGDQVPYALAFYAGLRRAEIHRARGGPTSTSTASACTYASRSPRRAPTGAPRSRRRCGRPFAPRGCVRASRQAAR